MVNYTEARIREVAARHQIDPRTLRRALQIGIESVRSGIVGDRTRAAFAELQAGPADVGGGAVPEQAVSS